MLEFRQDGFSRLIDGSRFFPIRERPRLQAGGGFIEKNPPLVQRAYSRCRRPEQHGATGLFPSAARSGEAGKKPSRRET